jgi:GNAT superfamily N-acetyltransferase
MFKIVKPKKSEHKVIADIYNKAREPFLSIYSEEERKNLVEETEERISEMAKNRQLLCVKEKEKVLAYSAFRLKNNQTVWISSFYVLPEYQKKGTGRLLLEAIEGWGKNKGAKAIVLETHQKADWAIKFYQKNGYEIINDKLDKYPFDKVLDKKPVQGRPLLGKKII